MTERLKEGIILPVWVVGVMVTLLLALLAYNATFASTVTVVQQHTKSIEVLQKDKADKESVDKIYNKLDKIETLLINHMSKK
jgi:hypothetical protein